MTYKDEGAMERDIEEADESKLKIKKTIDKIDAILAPTSRGRLFPWDTPHLKS